MASDNGNVEIRCIGTRRTRDGKEIPCNMKLCEELPDGTFELKHRKKFEARVVLGHIKCPSCGRWQTVPVSPLRDQTITKEAENARRGN